MYHELRKPGTRPALSLTSTQKAKAPAQGRGFVHQPGARTRRDEGDSEAVEDLIGPEPLAPRQRLQIVRLDMIELDLTIGGIGRNGNVLHDDVPVPVWAL